VSYFYYLTSIFLNCYIQRLQRMISSNFKLRYSKKNVWIILLTFCNSCTMVPHLVTLFEIDGRRRGHMNWHQLKLSSLSTPIYLEPFQLVFPYLTKTHYHLTLNYGILKKMFGLFCWHFVIRVLWCRILTAATRLN
jgi:hypothetical protein